MNRRKPLAALLALLMLLLLPGIFSSASAIDRTRECRLTVEPGTTEYAEDLATAKVVTDLYLIASYNEDDSLSLLPGYEALVLPTGEEDDSSTWAQVAQQAARISLESGAPFVIGAPCSEPITQGVNGPLLPGLYLILARGEELVDYVRETEPEEGDPELYTVAETSDYTYSFVPQLVALPGYDSEAGEWSYELSVTLKTARSLRNGAIEIVKTLLSYETSSPAFFVFEITAELDGEVVYSDVAAMSFDGPGSKSLVIEPLPVGAIVTVREVYSGASYTLVSDGTQTAVVSTEETARVSFTNDYSTEDKHGSGVVNRFSYSEETNWTWEQLRDSGEARP